MTEREVLGELHRRGIRLRLTDGRLDVLAPPGALTPDLRESLAARRDGLIALLRRAETAAAPAEATAHPEDRHEPFPLTDVQHAYWVGRSPSVELGGVSTQFYFELEREGLDLARLERALRLVIDRHGMLRAVVEPDGRQRVLAAVPPYEIACRDLSGLSPEERAREIERVRGEMARRVLPADRWPLFEVRASRVAARTLRLHVTLDLLVVDAWSMYLLFRDWRRCYEDPARPPAPPDFTFRDYVVAGEAARGDGFRRAERYWLGRLDALPPAPDLPLAARPDRLGPPVFTRRCAALPRRHWRALREAARRRGLTPSVALMAAFAEVLGRWARRPDFTLNLTLFSRRPVHPEVGEVVGDFTSVILLVVDRVPGEPFEARAGRLQRRLMEDLEHLEFSGVRVLRERARRLGGGPGAAMPVVFTSALGIGNEGAGSIGEAMGFFGDFVHGISQTPQVWLDHQVMEERGGLVFNWDAVEDLFPAGVLDAMFAAYCDLVQRLCRDEAWATRGPLVGLPADQAEERRLVNATAADLPPRTLYGPVADRARERPDRPAVLWEGGRLTYGELLAHAHRLAHRLVAAGARRNALVAVALPRGWQQVAAVLAVAHAGAAYLPVDPRWPEARRHAILEQGAAGIVVTDAALRDALAWPPGTTLVAVTEPETRRCPDAPLPAAPEPGDLAYVIFTSGSTGRPKGVMIEHGAAANTIQDINHRFGVGPADRCLALSSLGFDLSVYDVFGLLAAGGAVVLPDQDRAHDPAHWSDLVEAHRVTIWNSVPQLMRAWIDGHDVHDRRPGAVLRVALLSGDWIPVDLPGRVRARYPDLSLVSLGGATEASIWSVAYPIGEVPPDWTRIPYGRPLANQRLHVLDAELEPCPTWVEGEIAIGGDGLAAGYWADPERTAERFLAHPGTGERLYRTGDLGRYLPGGDVEFLGRNDFQVKINGHRVELGEVEAALRRQPGVGAAVVTAATHPDTGGRQLVAYVVPASDAPAAEPDGDRLAPALAAGARALGEARADLAAEIDAYRAMWRALEALCPAVVARALARLGAFPAAGAAASAERIVEQHGLDGRHVGLLRQWLGLLTAAGRLETAGPGEHRCVRPLDAAALDAEVERGLAALPVPERCRPFADYFAACAGRQVELLTGAVSPLELLLPDGRWDVTDFLYADNPVSAALNRVAASVVRAFADRLPGDRPARLLELGAGTGATTTVVLDALPPGRASYRFTDVSSFFTERARRRFTPAQAMEYATLDVDRPFAAQGVPAGSADVVIAANVLHDARRLDETLAAVRSALAPGGLLLLVEGTVNSPIQLVTVGFLEGFGHFLDQRELPLLPVAAWRERLAAAGFERPSALPEDPAGDGVMVQHVIAARAPGGRAGPDADRLRAALERLLPDYMVPQRCVVLDDLPLGANGKVDLGGLPDPWGQAPAGGRVAPANDVERRLFAIWSEALGRDDFGTADDFFQLGGDSLHVVHIMGRLRDEFGVDLSGERGLQRLFETPTIATLAASLGVQA